MTGRFASLVLAVCALSCGPRKSFELVLDPDFAQDEVVRLEQASAFWKKNCDVDIVFVNDRPYEAPGIIMRNAVPQTCDGGLECMGYTWASQEVIGLDQNFSIALAAHEMGHLLGLHHVQHGLMQPSAMPLQFSSEDAEQMWRLGLCD